MAAIKGKNDRITFVRQAPDVQIEQLLDHRDALLRLLSHLTTLVSDARVQKQCWTHDSCDICNAETAIEKFLRGQYDEVYKANE